MLWVSKLVLSPAQDCERESVQKTFFLLWNPPFASPIVISKLQINSNEELLDIFLKKKLEGLLAGVGFRRILFYFCWSVPAICLAFNVVEACMRFPVLNRWCAWFVEIYVYSGCVCVYIPTVLKITLEV